MEKSDKADLNKAYWIAIVVACFTIASFLVYAWLVSFIGTAFDPFNGLFPLIKGDTLKYVLMGTSVAISLLIRLLKKVLPSGRVSVRLPAQVKKRLNIESDGAQRLLMTSVITFALCELVALFGVAVFLVSGHALDFYIFLVLAIILITINFPLRKEWGELVKDFTKKTEQE